MDVIDKIEKVLVAQLDDVRQQIRLCKNKKKLYQLEGRRIPGRHD